MIKATNKTVTKLMLTVFALVLSFGAANAQETLLISEYIEGSSNNKAIELFNPNSTAISLDSYQIAQSVNGGGWEYYHTFPGGATIAPYGTYVIITDQVDAGLFAAADADEVLGYPSVVHHNGDDARAIIHISGTDTTVVDLFGNPDEDPGSGWAVGDSVEATANHTLVRKSAIAVGNTTALGSFGTDDATSEWTVRAQNDFSNLGAHSFADAPFTLRDFNFYEFPVGVNDLGTHPLTDSTRTFTAVVTSYPKSSGLATPNDTDTDGTIDDIGRIHMFITDTAAVSQGRAGMSIQVVESDYKLVEGFTRGDVVTFTGRLTFFNSTSQVTVDETPVPVGNVNQDPELAPYAALLDPWEITADELNILHEDGTHEINIDNYWKYNGAYVKLAGATVSNVSTGDRPNWAVNESGSRVYIYDTSLRYRNDRVAYLPSYNYRHGADTLNGDFVPPAPGSVVDINGFINLVGDDPDGNVTAGSQAFSINPMEDGVLWINGTRFESGDDIGGGVTLDWPDDLTVIGAPPVFSEAMLSDSTVTSSDAITASVTIVGVDDATITEANLIYSAAGVTDTLAMTAAGDVYTATIPAQDNFTPVSFYFEATDSDGLVGRDPIAGNYGYFVQDGAIDAISLIQTTSDGGPGASPLAGAGTLEMNISGTIVSDSEDGVIIVQDDAAAWSGVFLEQTTETSALSRGDIINITSAEVVEAAVASNSLTLTQLVNLTFTVTSSGNDTEAVIPTLTSDEVVAGTVSGELEAYEGMVVKFEDAMFTDRGAYGEYTLMSAGSDSTDGAIFNEDIRSDEQIGTVGVSYDFNHAIRLNKTMDAYAVVAASFGAPKFHPRDAADFMPEDGNAFTPVLDFPLVSPVDSAEVTVTADVEVTWTATEDFDGDDVTYEWVLYSADTSSVVVTVPSNNDGADAVVTIPALDVDGLLEGAGLAVGESATFVWNVRVSDGLDTLNVHGPYGNFGDDFMPIYRTITLTRGMVDSNEDLDGTPRVFSLEQNYPNPFNPSTNIRFSLPQTSNVTLVVYDMLGRRVATLLDGEQMNAANHTVKFDASAMASGMYIYRLEAGSFVSTRKMMLIK